MEPKIFFQYEFKVLYNAWNGQERNISKTINGFSPFVSKFKNKQISVMAREVSLTRLKECYDNWTDVKSSDKGTCVKDSFMGKLFANGFNMAYNYCEKYAQPDPSKPPGKKEIADIAFHVTNLDVINERDKPQTTKISKDYVINLGRIDGAYFYLAMKGFENPPVEKDNLPAIEHKTPGSIATNVTCLALEQNLNKSSSTQQVIHKVKEIVSNSKDKAIVGYCILALIHLGLTESSQAVLKKAFKSDFYPKAPQKAFDTSVNRIIRSYHQKNIYSGKDKGEIWGDKRQNKYQEVLISIKKALYPT